MLACKDQVSIGFLFDVEAFFKVGQLLNDKCKAPLKNIELLMES